MIATLLRSCIVCSTSNVVSDANLSLQHTCCVSIMAESASSVLYSAFSCLAVWVFYYWSCCVAISSTVSIAAAVQFALSSVKQQASYLIVRQPYYYSTTHHVVLYCCVSVIAGWRAKEILIWLKIVRRSSCTLESDVLSKRLVLLLLELLRICISVFTAWFSMSPYTFFISLPAKLCVPSLSYLYWTHARGYIFEIL